MTEASPFWEDPAIVERFANRPPDERLLEILPSYSEPARTRVLDLGCAGGRNTVVLAERGFDWYALDASRPMVEHTRQRISGLVGEGVAERRVLHGSMHDLGRFAAGYFDLVVALGVYHSAGSRTEWDRALDETTRVLAVRGLLLTANFSPRSDPKGEGLRPVPDQPHVYLGFDAGPTYLLEAEALDAAMARRGLSPVRDTYTVETATETGCRVTVNGMYRKDG